MSSLDATSADAGDDHGNTAMAFSSDASGEVRTDLKNKHTNGGADGDRKSTATPYSDDASADARDEFENTVMSSSNDLPACDSHKTAAVPSLNNPSAALAKIRNSKDPSMLIFTLFPRLPIELRLKIWRETLPLFPRIIELSNSSINFDDQGRRVMMKPWTVALNSPPILLAVCKEARQKLLSFYVQPFEPSATKSDGRRTEDLHMNLELDNLFLRSESAFRPWPREGLSLCLGEIFGENYDTGVKGRLKHLAFDFSTALAMDVHQTPEGVDGLDELFILFGRTSITSLRGKGAGMVVFKDREIGAELVEDYSSFWKKLKWVPEKFCICYYRWEKF